MPKSWWEKKVKRTKQTLEELNSAHRRSQAKWGSNIGFVHPASHYLFSLHPAQRNVSIPIPPACMCQHAIDVNVTGRLALKWIENTLYCFRTKGNIPEMRTWDPQWNAEGQNRTTTWKMSARGFSSLGLFAWSKWYISTLFTMSQVSRTSGFAILCATLIRSVDAWLTAFKLIGIHLKVECAIQVLNILKKLKFWSASPWWYWCES